MQTLTSSLPRYRPISCEFHDHLETFSLVRKRVQLQFRDPQGVIHSRTVVITDVFARNGEEYLETSTGETLRLDQLLAVDDVRLADC